MAEEEEEEEFQFLDLLPQVKIGTGLVLIYTFIANSISFKDYVTKISGACMSGLCLLPSSS